jgi:addiction module RelB/DinJ family antitoxin
MTPKASTVRARISPDLKKSAEAVLEKLGLNNSQAINIFYSQIVLHKGFPFPLSLEQGDLPEKYTKVKGEAHFKSLIGLE